MFKGALQGMTGRLGGAPGSVPLSMRGLGDDVTDVSALNASPDPTTYTSATGFVDTGPSYQTSDGTVYEGTPVNADSVTLPETTIVGDSVLPAMSVSAGRLPNWWVLAGLAGIVWLWYEAKKDRA